MASATLRWAVAVKRWEPHPEEWTFLLQLLPQEEVKQVETFKFVEDQKRALISRLLQRRCCQAVFGLRWDQVVIKRTKGRKPYLATPLPNKQYAPNFNFNVSHEGDYVALASEPLCLCGVDVAAPQQARAQRPAGFAALQKSYQRQLTLGEWATVRSLGPDEAAMDDMFRCIWSLKEAFVKARGDGLGFDLGRSEFTFPQGPKGSTAAVAVDGQPQSRWHFVIQQLGSAHWVSVARGPPDNAVDAYGEFTGTFHRPTLSDAEIQEALLAPAPPFMMLGVVDLVPEGLRDAYEAAGGDML
ncbi:hypothetical protein WJX72_001038 [[Myrmecia] bisecta]|uniref:holo-[acyl-carrier-protein] synthase n=1 Tax=[Myrmecia] bisecta TaxID=41462 RepID=A0AAW1Q120_9CHLO